MRDKTVGILGGMGPEASVDLFAQIIKNTPVIQEEDHLRILIDNNPKLPNRQEAILSGGISPLPELIEMAQNLQNSGADFLILGANTAYYWYDELIKSVAIPILHMVDEALKVLLAENPDVKRVGILSADALAKSGMYEKSCARFGLEAVLPRWEMQQKLHDAIFGFKKDGNQGHFRNEVQGIIHHLNDLGIEAIILGCTEIPIIMERLEIDVPLINPNDTIAKAVVRFAKHLT